MRERFPSRALLRTISFWTPAAALARILEARRRARESVRQEAAALLQRMGGSAYGEARDRARAARRAGDRASDVHWTRVAVAIAEMTGKIIGQKVADRYELARLERPIPPDQSTVAEVLVELGVAIQDLAGGRAHATTLHNAEAAINRFAALRQDAACQARELRSALRSLAAVGHEDAPADIRMDRFDAASTALQALRRQALPLK